MNTFSSFVVTAILTAQPSSGEPQRAGATTTSATPSTSVEPGSARSYAGATAPQTTQTQTQTTQVSGGEQVTINSDGSKTIVVQSQSNQQVIVRQDLSGHIQIETREAMTDAKRYPATVPQKDRELLYGDHTADPRSMKFRPGKGLEITSKNDKFKIVPRLRIQFRSESQSQRLEGEEPDLTTSFQLRRARLQFAGHVFGKHNKYKAEFAFSPRDLGYKEGRLTRTPMLTWYAEFDYLWWATLRVGQYKIPYSRQRVVSSGNLELVDRTMANGEFNLDRDIGFDIRAKGKGGWKERFRYYAGIYVGEGRDGFQTESLRTSPGGGLMYLGRVEVLPFGSFKDYSEVDFARTRKPRLSLGGAYVYLDKAKK
ncbi:MAG: porin, partial [Nannocystaceae bacterium]